MAGFTVINQTFASCDIVSEGLLQDPVSGLMGLAWQPIASSGATPFWEVLVQEESWNEPLMAFHLTRYLNDQQAHAVEPGGSFDMGESKVLSFIGSHIYVF